MYYIYTHISVGLLLGIDRTDNPSNSLELED